MMMCKSMTASLGVLPCLCHSSCMAFDGPITLPASLPQVCRPAFLSPTDIATLVLTITFKQHYQLQWSNQPPLLASCAIVSPASPHAPKTLVGHCHPHPLLPHQHLLSKLLTSGFHDMNVPTPSQPTKPNFGQLPPPLLLPTSF